MDDLKPYGKSENQVDILVQSVRVVSEENGTWNTKMCSPGHEEEDTSQVRGYCHRG